MNSALLFDPSSTLELSQIAQFLEYATPDARAALMHATKTAMLRDTDTGIDLDVLADTLTALHTLVLPVDISSATLSSLPQTMRERITSIELWPTDREATAGPLDLRVRFPNLEKLSMPSRALQHGVLGDSESAQELDLTLWVEPNAQRVSVLGLLNVRSVKVLSLLDGDSGPVEPHVDLELRDLPHLREFADDSAGIVYRTARLDNLPMLEKTSAIVAVEARCRNINALETLAIDADVRAVVQECPSLRALAVNVSLPAGSLVINNVPLLTELDLGALPALGEVLAQPSLERVSVDPAVEATALFAHMFAHNLNLAMIHNGTKPIYRPVC